MRKVLFTLFSVIVSVLCFAGETVWVYDSNGTRTPYELAKVDSLSFAEPDYLYLYPDVENLSSDGGRFSVYIDSKKPWTATVSDPTAIILSKSSGNGGESINVSAFPNTDSRPYSETVTFKLDDGTTAMLTVNVSVEDEYIKLYLADEEGERVPFTEYSYKNVSRSGGEFEIYVSSNTYWRSSYYDNIHLSQTSGKYDETIKVTVDPNTGKNELASDLYFYTTGNQSLHVGVKQDGSTVSVGPAIQRFPPTGGTGRLGIKSNSNWSVSSNQEWIKVGQLDGALNDSIDIYVDESNDAKVTTATITVKTAEGKSASCRVNRTKEQLSVLDSINIIGYRGGSFNVSVNSNNSWYASSDKSWATMSNTSGVGNDTITIFVEENTEQVPDTALITFIARNGTQDRIIVGRAAIGLLEKCKASDYEQITIGDQTWMAENYRCSKYDTQSEAYNASWLTNNMVPKAENSYTYTPYYTDAANKDNWSSVYSGDISNEQIAKLGYSYNWAAAVGVKNGTNQTSEFKGNRQGICPNGWHIPTSAEWQTLYDYIYSAQGLSNGAVGKYLKATLGWYNNGNGTDSFGFAALPSGYADGSSIIYVGSHASFWTATPNEDYSTYYANFRYLWYGSDGLGDLPGSNYNYEKYHGQSVRCLKD